MKDLHVSVWNYLVAQASHQHPDPCDGNPAPTTRSRLTRELLYLRGYIVHPVAARGWLLTASVLDEVAQPIVIRKLDRVETTEPSSFNGG
jgi:hypothetical protein